MLNPYRQFERLKPVAIIQDGVLVFDGSFDVPLASALSHVQRSGDLLRAKQPQQALAEARTAVQIAPDALQTQMALGDAFAALNRSDDARAAYEKALTIAHTMEPSAQEVWVPQIEKKLADRVRSAFDGAPLRDTRYPRLVFDLPCRERGETGRDILSSL